MAEDGVVNSESLYESLRITGAPGIVSSSFGAPELPPTYAFRRLAPFYRGLQDAGCSAARFPRN